MNMNISCVRKTKIVATLGPASCNPQQIEALFVAGVDVFRLNFSHGSHDEHARTLEHIRKIESDMYRPVGVIADLQGPKLRIGVFAQNEITLTRDQTFRLDSNPDPGDQTRVCLPHPRIMEVMEEGMELLLDDGRVKLVVLERGPDYLDCRVEAGHTLSNRKGLNVPGVVLPVSALTDKDRVDMEFALTHGVDWIALSFVQRPEDVIEARGLIDKRAKLIAKIEKPSALVHLDALIELTDAVMLARGDLGVEIPAENVPSIQKMLVRKSRVAGKPVIVATQMLESMVNCPSPTRAEASDVATAVYDGTDAVMLSAETATGRYPIEAVTMMDKIARRVETDPLYRKIMDADHPAPHHTEADAIAQSAARASETLEAALIATYTLTGSTTLRAVRERPQVPILCLTSNRSTSRCMCLSYGVHSVLIDYAECFDDILQIAGNTAQLHGLATSGQPVVVTASYPFNRAGATNLMHVTYVDNHD